MANLPQFKTKRQGLPQPKRLIQLNQIAIIQMQSLLGSRGVKKLAG
jgi:hypothetical protein